MEIRKSTAFLTGAALSSSLLWGTLHFSRESDQQEIARTRDRLEDYLGMKDQELLSRRSEIEKIQGLEGRKMLALLACIGARLDLAHAQSITAFPQAFESPITSSVRGSGPDSPLGSAPVNRGAISG